MVEWIFPTPNLANMRRAYSEAKAVVVYDMKKKFDPSTAESASVRQVPTVELASRLQQLQSKVIGLDLLGENEPSHSLFNEVAAIKDQNA
eukprot:6426625-Amphidinium_carterae.1